MFEIVLASFLIAHGGVHLLYLAPRPDDDPKYPFAPETRWSARAFDLSEHTAKAIAGSLAVTCAVVFLVAGAGLLADAEVWKAAAVLGATTSLALMLAFMHRWLLIGIAIDVLIITGVLSSYPSSVFGG